MVVDLGKWEVEVDKAHRPGTCQGWLRTFYFWLCVCVEWVHPGVKIQSCPLRFLLFCMFVLKKKEKAQGPGTLILGLYFWQGWLEGWTWLKLSLWSFSCAISCPLPTTFLTLLHWGTLINRVLMLGGEGLYLEGILLLFWPWLWRCSFF